MTITQSDQADQADQPTGDTRETGEINAAGPDKQLLGTPGALRYVFVYGTLRRGEQRDITLLRPAPVFIGMSQTPGVLYHLGACAYPGLRLNGPAAVRGEVYQITPELERQLDEIESVWPQQSGEYARQEIVVRVTDSNHGERVLTCLVYEVSLERIRGMAVIASGDWCGR